jgi:hypothetical protein
MGDRKQVETKLSYRRASKCCLAGRGDKPIPTRFLVPIDCSKTPAQETTSKPECVNFKGPRNRFLCSLKVYKFGYRISKILQRILTLACDLWSLFCPLSILSSLLHTAQLLLLIVVPLMLFSAVKWVGDCSEDAVYEGWDPVPGTITPGSVLNVHWVQAVCEPRENSGSRQEQQRALSTRVSCRCLDMHWISTVKQNYYITRKEGKRKARKEAL